MIKNLKIFLKSLIPTKLKVLLYRIFIKKVHFDEVKFIYCFFKELKVKSGVMIDVGAHKGSSADFFAASGWKVHCFEPDKKNFDYLKKKFKKNLDIYVTNYAVTNKTGNQSFYQSSITDGINSLVNFHNSHNLAYKVETIKLKDYLIQRKINAIDFLKIDVEGGDFDVIKSIDLNLNKPNIILMEYEDAKVHKLGFTTKDILNYLNKNKYYYSISEWFPIVEYGKKHKWRRILNINERNYDPLSWGNIIASKDKDLLNKLISFIKFNRR